ncbi:fumarylacetoacetate hydrolase family protein [Oceanisphaera sp. IT1-181]|uniref:fumarylacetoacetate hydrolase family protein n=1 Tax=Oceanisphaera sp. IT1-181 TaxID=3081199 RepID=UPI0029CAA239|nr:fumarylacetoacetate hydrolase family protein [Oceanisphaera sp. IT1-181]
MYQHLDIQGQPLPYGVGKVVCVGRSYRDHATELNNPIPSEPLLFIKPASSLVNLSAPLVLPKGLGAIHHEVEVALLIGRRLCHADEAEALAGIVGVGVALDLTLRDVQDKLKAQGHPWERAKAFDGSCPISPFVVPDCVNRLSELEFSLAVNGQLRQVGNTRDLMWPVGLLLTEMSRCFTLNPGDIVLTGTPKGVGELLAKDSLELQLDGQYRFNAVVAG